MGGVSGVLCTYISPKEVSWLSKEQGLVVAFWAKVDPIWAKIDPPGQFVRKVGKSALELGGKKFNHVGPLGASPQQDQ